MIVRIAQEQMCQRELFNTFFNCQQEYVNDMIVCNYSILT